MSNNLAAIRGAGLGLRRDIIDDLENTTPKNVDFMEIAPENWIDVGGSIGQRLHTFTEKFPFVTHGLSLSLGSPAPLDYVLLEKIKKFLDLHHIAFYTEHLSYCSDAGHLYDLMPIPFTNDAIKYVASRIQDTQNILERKIAIENVSYYASPGQEISELDFLNGILEESGCMLLLDINNVYVNSINHKYDPLRYLEGLPRDKIAYMHIAGHSQEDTDLIVDTHGANVIEPVWNLLKHAYKEFGPIPTLLERDFNFPPITDLLTEVSTIKKYQAQAQQ